MIRLEPMTEVGFEDYLAKAIPEYAADKAQAGNWPEAEALELSRKEYQNLLPEGLKTVGNYLFTLVNNHAEAVGYLWYARLEKRPEAAFIFDFEVYSAFRRQGYASQALAALVLQAGGEGFKKLELHVFGYNTAARELYKKSGFIETNVNMARDI